MRGKIEKVLDNNIDYVCTGDLQLKMHSFQKNNNLLISITPPISN